MCKEMEEPCVCDHCKELFDLQDGWASEKWYENTVICNKCFQEEKKEVERDNEVEELNEIIDSALYDLKDARKRLIELNASRPSEQNKLTEIIQTSIRQGYSIQINKSVSYGYIELKIINGEKEITQMIKNDHHLDDIHSVIEFMLQNTL